MKKLLILMLVLGMTSAASAALSLGGVIDGTIDVGTTGIVTVESTDSTMWEGFIGYDDSVVGVSGVVAKAAAGGDAEVIPDPSGWTGYYKIIAMDSSEPFTTGPGVQFEISVFGAALNDIYTIDFYAADWSTIIQSGTVEVIPEPMTIALLGLGGLFLLRRRK